MKILVRVLRILIPSSLRIKLAFIKNRFMLSKLCKNDKNRYQRYAVGFSNYRSQKQLETLITINYHSIEKGLSNPYFRAGFGEKALNMLLDNLDEYFLKYDSENIRFQLGLSVVQKYIEKHNSIDYRIDKVVSRFEKYKDFTLKYQGGANKLYKNDIVKNAHGDFRSLAFSRHSVRNYSSAKIDVEKIIDAISIAIKTPSVCNRQSWHVHIVKTKKTIEEILKIQNGLRGDGENTQYLLLISSDVTKFYNPYERYQSFVDGGMFAMSLLYSLTYKGLATCALNGDLSQEQDTKIRRILNLTNNQDIIMFISVGNYPEEFTSPVSFRDLIEHKFTQY